MIGTRTFFDALGVKIRVHYKAIPHRAGHARRRHPMKSWLRLEHNEGAKFGLRVINELKNRAVEDVLISVVDGLKGFPQTITAVFPQATVQTWQLLRLKPVTAAVKGI